MARKALCIGINDYPGTGCDLAGCVNDAHDWAEALTKRSFAVKLLADGLATKAAITLAISELVAGAARGDTLAITYSGHGTWVPDNSGNAPDGREDGLCPHDIGRQGPLLNDELHALFSGRGAGVRILLLSDCCHAGGVSLGLEDDLDKDLPRIRFLPPAAWMPKEELPPRGCRPLQLVSGMPGAGSDLRLTGCHATEYVWDTRFRGRPNGAFSYYALKTLRDGNPVTYEDWLRAIRAYLPSPRLPQSPQILGAQTARRMRVFE